MPQESGQPPPPDKHSILVVGYYNANETEEQKTLIQDQRVMRKGKHWVFEKNPQLYGIKAAIYDSGQLGPHKKRAFEQMIRNYNEQQHGFIELLETHSAAEVIARLKTLFSQAPETESSQLPGNWEPEPANRQIVRNSPIGQAESLPDRDGDIEITETLRLLESLAGKLPGFAAAIRKERADHKIKTREFEQVIDGLRRRLRERA